MDRLKGPDHQRCNLSPLCEICHVTNGDIVLHPEMPKHRSQCTAVKLKAAYLTLETNW